MHTEADSQGIVMSQEQALELEGSEQKCLIPLSKFTESVVPTH